MNNPQPSAPVIFRRRPQHYGCGQRELERPQRPRGKTREHETRKIRHHRDQYDGDRECQGNPEFSPNGAEFGVVHRLRR